MNAKRIVSIHPGTDRKGHWVIEGVDEHGYVRYYDLKNWVSDWRQAHEFASFAEARKWMETEAD